MSKEKGRNAASALIGTLGQAGLEDLQMTELRSVFAVDFMMAPTRSWEKRNMSSAVRVTMDGGVAGVQLRPPAAHESMSDVVRRAARTAASSTSDPASWSFKLEQKDSFGDRIEDVRPHVTRSSRKSGTIGPTDAGRDIIAAVKAYRSVTRSH